MGAMASLKIFILIINLLALMFYLAGFTVFCYDTEFNFMQVAIHKMIVQIIFPYMLIIRINHVFKEIWISFEFGNGKTGDLFKSGRCIS